MNGSSALPTLWSIIALPCYPLTNSMALFLSLVATAPHTFLSPWIMRKLEHIAIQWTGENPEGSRIFSENLHILVGRHGEKAILEYWIEPWMTCVQDSRIVYKISHNSNSFDNPTHTDTQQETFMRFPLIPRTNTCTCCQRREDDVCVCGFHHGFSIRSSLALSLSLSSSDKSTFKKRASFVSSSLYFTSFPHHFYSHSLSLSHFFSTWHPSLFLSRISPPPAKIYQVSIIHGLLLPKRYIQSHLKNLTNLSVFPMRASLWCMQARK